MKTNALWMIALALSVGAVVAGEAAGYAETIVKTRAERVAQLTKPDGWLTLIGLHFLSPGENTIGSAKDNAIVLAAGPAHVGRVTLAADGAVSLALAEGVDAKIDGRAVRTAELKSVAGPVKPTLVTAGTVSFFAVDRGGKKALRVKDSAAAARTHFLGLDYFPIDPVWRIEARWEPFEKSRLVPVTNMLGQSSPEPIPGKAVFERDGKTYELLPIDEGRDVPLFFVISDATSGKETYGGCRFLYVAWPKEGERKIVLDFNLTENPPCAFTAFSTCPLPPKENRLPFAVTVGEKNYRGRITKPGTIGSLRGGEGARFRVTPMSEPRVKLNRRDFLASAATGAAAMSLTSVSGRAASAPAAGAKLPVLMKAGHQHDHSEPTLQALAAFGVNNICSGHLSREVEKDWTVDALTRLRKHVESFGIKLDAVPLPLPSSNITRAEMPEILLAKDPERDKAIEDIGTMIRNCGKAGIPMVKYNFTFIGVVSTAPVPSRGGAVSRAFDYSVAKDEGPYPNVGRITEEIYWDRITYFLKRVVPIAEEAKVKIACHPQDPAMPKGKGWRGVETVLGSPAGLKKFVGISESPYHGLNFCQGTVSEMLEKPGEQIYDVIRELAGRKKIFNVHFRNIRGGFLKFHETFPDDGDVDMPRALRAYRDAGYDGMIMPDHVPTVAGDTTRQKSFAFCFGYIQALLQTLRAEA